MTPARRKRNRNSERAQVGAWLERRTAHHEAGHAVVALALPDFHEAIGLGDVVLGRSRHAGGILTFGHIGLERGLEWALAGKSARLARRIRAAYLVVLWSGMAAEMAFSGDGDDLAVYIEDELAKHGLDYTDEPDLPIAEEALRGFRYRNVMRERTQVRSVDLVRENWPAVQRVAAALIRRKRLDRFEVERAMIDPALANANKRRVRTND